MHLMPTFEMRMGEGAFGAGPGSRLDWENRWDLGVQARWNLTEFLGSKQRKRLADLKIQQAHLSYHDLRGKLTPRRPARPSKPTQRPGPDDPRRPPDPARRGSVPPERHAPAENIKGRSPSEVLLADPRAWSAARLSYLHAIRDFDKAQLRSSSSPAARTPE